jgi:hypothetical protein
MGQHLLPIIDRAYILSIILLLPVVPAAAVTLQMIRVAAAAVPVAC